MIPWAYDFFSFQQGNILARTNSKKDITVRIYATIMIANEFDEID